MSEERILDLRGLKCPLPVMKTRKAMARLAPGARLVVETTDPMAAIDIPHFCNEAGHRLLARDLEAGVGRFVIEKG
ncbi:sulfurtransferase TusA family protein [Polymorphum gilvum]|uniref:Putative Sulfurtransferase TusA-like protein n=1 Tax=Polymorphum gilvum (strain LMG 25793 / CGMCC 1.9160 / SL003B-26A1) TaxID=991905 RepID=F2J0E5_POLGS|nr:sulfurtransferase TusA family protein [Polymorphum gilvum]ADZ68679.1 Putative Sulfurtransferase TusA-like protein [Polymorphum gilvum SL003B-26A1]